MSEIFEETRQKRAYDARSYRVSYTINNVQPVVCTIIGDHPLFYMNYDEAYEDDQALFHDLDAKGLEGEMRAIQTEIGRLNELSAGFLKSGSDKMAELFDNKAALLGLKSQKIAKDIGVLENILSQSRLGKAYLDHAAEYGVKLQYCAQVETSHYDRDLGLILINPTINETDALLLAVQELRRHWQHRQGVLIHPLMFHPDNAVVVHRVQMADLVVAMVRISWELQLSGEKSAWERLENSSMSDLARAFAREAFFDFRTVNNGQACAAVFENWFLSERCRVEDKNLVQQMLADYKGYIFDLQTSEQMITPALIAGLGSMPFGKNYLAEHAALILHDPIFTEVRDRSNANFLWFIKFERSFRETEHKLQSSQNLSAGDVHSPVSATDKQDLCDETAFAARAAVSGQIVNLFPAGREYRPAATLKQSGGHDATVVYLRHWPQKG